MPPLHAIWATLSLLKSVKVGLGRGAQTNARKCGNFFTLEKGVKINLGRGRGQFGQCPKERPFLFKDSFPLNHVKRTFKYQIPTKLVTSFKIEIWVVEPWVSQCKSAPRWPLTIHAHALYNSPFVPPHEDGDDHHLMMCNMKISMMIMIKQHKHDGPGAFSLHPRGAHCTTSTTTTPISKWQCWLWWHWWWWWRWSWWWWGGRPLPRSAPPPQWPTHTGAPLALPPSWIATKLNCHQVGLPPSWIATKR